MFGALVLFLIDPGKLLAGKNIFPSDYLPYLTFLFCILLNLLQLKDVYLCFQGHCTLLFSQPVQFSSVPSLSGNRLFATP